MDLLLKIPDHGKIGIQKKLTIKKAIELISDRSFRQCIFADSSFN
jgi:hypothetical protein